MNKIKRIWRLKQLKKLRQRLESLIEQLIKSGVVDQTLLNFIRSIEDADKQIRTWRKVLNRDLTSINLYEISEAINDEALKKDVEQRYVKMAIEDELVNAIKYGRELLQEMAFGELSERIRKARIRKNRAREILYRVFEEVPKFREMSWEVVKYLEPTDRELQKLLDLPFINKAEFEGLRLKIQRLIWDKPREKNHNTKIISQIQKIRGKLAELEKGQS